MNSIEELSAYKPVFIKHNNRNPIKTAATTYDFPEHPPKKDKKWSIGNLFRRKKKDDSDSGSEDQKKNFLSKKRKKHEKRKKTQMGAFDHIVFPSQNSTKYITSNGQGDPGFLSEPSGGFESYVGRPLPRIPAENTVENDCSHNSLGSTDSLNKKSRRERAKARALARRNSFQQDSSSDEDSLRSYSSNKIKSDDSLSRHRDSSMGRRTRSARTERYIRRLSKDDEFILNREAMQREVRENWRLPEQRLNYKSNSRDPINSYDSYTNISQLNFSGLFTIPPSHYKHKNEYKHVNPATKPSNCYNLCSLSCEANIHKSPSPEIMHVQFPLGKSKYQQRLKQPPAPPPRDPRRVVQCDNNRPYSNYIRFNESNEWHPRFRTGSEDHIPNEPKYTLTPRPSSVTNENRNRFITSHTRESTEGLQYLTEKKPRSRKPIFIQSADKINQNYGSQNYWRANEQTKPLKPSQSISPQMFTSKSHIQTKIFLPSVLKTEPNQETQIPSRFKPISFQGLIENTTQENEPIKNLTNELEITEVKQSANLEEALDELEAIYKSLHLGDEDLLERAEQREMSIVTKNAFLRSTRSGAMSDSSFSYEPVNDSDEYMKRKVLKKSQTLDRKNDDMAFRKFQKGRVYNSDNTSPVMSYLLASPIHMGEDEVDGFVEHKDEPDITLDDVVYRSIKHANNTLKVIDPQPPFGIPIGPVTPAPNSDYLHAVPEYCAHKKYEHKYIPDVVKDDLAFRNLRKDPTKKPALKAASPEDFENNNFKKRAARCLSANLSHFIQNEKYNVEEKENTFKKTSLSDIADAMEIARNILKEKENRISSNKRAFLSDSEMKYRKQGITSGSSTETITESRLNFLNEMRGKDLRIEFLHTKSPRCATPVRNVNDTSAPTESIENELRPHTSSFEELLTALAIETQETSVRITNELNNFDDTIRKEHKILTKSDDVSEHTKLCEKLLECVVETKELITANKEDKMQPLDTAILEPVANVKAAIKEKIEDTNTEIIDINEDENEMESLIANVEDLDTFPLSCKSPFEEHKSELIATFKELKLDESQTEHANSGEKRLRKLKKSPRFKSCDIYPELVMSEKDIRADRVDFYKEERRCQNIRKSNETSSKLTKDSTSSISDSPRINKVTNILSFAAANVSPSSHSRSENKETRFTSMLSNSSTDSSSMKIEKDKSGKRKSGLNRSQTSEEVLSDIHNDGRIRRRRRRSSRNELQQSLNISSNEDKIISDINCTALSSMSSSITASVTNKSTTKKSDFRIHEENARSGIPVSPSEVGKTRLSRKTSNEERKTKVDDIELHRSNKENIKRKTCTSNKMTTKTAEKKTTKSRLSNRIDNLSALTRKTLAAVERIANETRDSPKPGEIHSKSKASSLKNAHAAIDEKITKKNLEEETVPVSILKRRVSQDESKSSPVTFSPNAADPTLINYKQGILKKHRSFDESQVSRHRSCSPDVAGKYDSKSVLISLLRSSLDDVMCLPSDNIHGILKRNISKAEDDQDTSLNSPQGILKRKSGASSAGSSSSTHQHVSITTAVILAAAEGAEMVLDESVKPILKKKSIDDTQNSHTINDNLKPILKKKSSTDTDEGEEKPKRPILKQNRPADRRDSYTNDSSSECDMKPILKHELQRQRLLLECDNKTVTSNNVDRRRPSQLGELQLIGSSTKPQEKDRDLTKPRINSVFDLVMNFEKSTGTVPKKSTFKRNNRSKTQPVTLNELEASLNFVPSQEFRTLPQLSSIGSSHDVQRLLDFTSSPSPNHDSWTKCMITGSSSETSFNSGICKMSSDSEFHSLEERVVLENDSMLSSPEKMDKTKNSKLKMQMSAIALEAKNFRLSKDSDKAVQSKSDSSFCTDSSKSSPRLAANKTSHSDIAGSILKSENVDHTFDEDISSDDSDSDTKYESDRTESDVSRTQPSSKSDHTSDESSGGREVQSIIAGDAIARRRQKMDRKKSLNVGCVLKSKSQSLLTNGIEQRLPTGVQKSVTTAAMHRTIGELQAKLQQSGDNDWKKRLPKLNNASDELNLLNAKNIYNEQLYEKKSILEAKKDELDASAIQWKTRVEKADAVNFSVAGRMQIKNLPSIPINIPAPDKVRKTPKAKRFKGKEDDIEDSCSPESPDLCGNLSFKENVSIPMTTDDSSASDSSLIPASRRIVEILKPDDDTYKSFFKGIETKITKEYVDISLDDFDNVSKSAESLLVQKKDIRVLRRMKPSSKNPLKVLAARSDIQNKYTEIITGIAEREVTRLNIQKLAKGSNLAIEALAGLASNEDFASVSLKKASGLNGSYLPFKSLMLLQIKGRRHVQTRLVEPTAASINQGDNYILITPNSLYNYIGPYSNIIEQSRASDIINHIQHTGDMGCKIDEPIIINMKKTGSTKDLEDFWNHLGAEKSPMIAEAGHPDEDENYESNIVDTNMIYTLENKELVPLDNSWGAIPKVNILKPSKVLVFDFGSELYVWSGKNAVPDEKKAALKLAKQLWDDGYNYTDCSVCPLNVSKMLGARNKSNESFKSDSRPKWALFAKITQHRETILFREKFLDWPDYSRVIRLKDKNNEKSIDASINIKPCDVNTFLETNFSEPDFEVEGNHLGRGRNYYDEETNRHFEINTLDVTCWTIFENNYEKLGSESMGHFYDADTYIVRWKFRMSVSGREFSGKPSKYSQIGRDRCVYFCWLGKNASVNEKGTAALLTVELDLENARQIRVNQGSEPAAFLQLFDGKMFVHIGKRELPKNKKRLYISRGEIEHETVLFEVPCSVRSLRSRASFILTEEDKVTVWNGAKSLEKTRNLTKSLAEYICNMNSSQFCLKSAEMNVLEEGNDQNFLNATNENRRLYNSLVDSNDVFDFTPRLFYFNSISGSFEVMEILCPHRSEYTTPFPFLQSELYSVGQPALFLIDNKHELWLWQGWWPERETDLELSEQTGSGAVRWQMERKVAMQTAVEYWKASHGDLQSTNAYLIWAGLEPLSFTNLFPIWYDRDDVAELNAKDGKKAGDMVLIEKELALLTRTTYPLDELLQRPLPHGVDPTHLEIYLSSEDFVSFLSISREEFQNLPPWKQTALKKEKGLF